MDKKELIGENEHAITQHEIDAWNRGKKDAGASARLAALNNVSVKKAIAIIKMWAELGDFHYVSTRFDIDVNEARKIMSAFDINSIEDAKAAIRKGVISEYEDAMAETRAEGRALDETKHKEAQERLDAYVQEEPVKTEEEQDAKLAQQRNDAQRQNKEDRLRQLIAEGIDAKTNTSNFRIPIGMVGRFKQMIPHGVTQLQRQFGGSSKDIVDEIKRLAPEYDVDMLRR